MKIKRHIEWLLQCILCAFLLNAPSVMAQERSTAETKQAVDTETIKVKKMVSKPMRAKVANDEDQLRAAIEKCGAACRIGGPDSISAGDGTVLDYNCDENGNCSCFGAKDCVKMSSVCEEDTIGCNEHGCICKQGSGDGG